MACRCCPALVALRDEANRLWPNRDKASDGCCGDDAHANRVSDHNPDGEGYATAFDIDHDPVGGFDARHWSEVLRERRDPRIKYVIHAGRMYASYSTAARPAWTWGTYTGPNAHRSHMHVSVRPERKRDVGPWWVEAGAGPSPHPSQPPDPKEDDAPMPAPTDIVRVVPAGPLGIDPAAHIKLRADGSLEHHGTRLDAIAWGDYQRLKAEHRKGERRFVDLIVTASSITLYAHDRTDWRFDPGTAAMLETAPGG